jgi:hypothetical protein
MQAHTTAQVPLQGSRFAVASLQVIVWGAGPCLFEIDQGNFICSHRLSVTRVGLCWWLGISRMVPNAKGWLDAGTQEKRPCFASSVPYNSVPWWKVRPPP